MRRRQKIFPIRVCLVLALALNLTLWLGSRHVYARWGGVPPVPSEAGASVMGLGDRQFFYRFGAITLQNFGDTGGKVTPLKDYNYKKLGDWFSLLHLLDPASDHVPMVAAYYFGGTRIPDDVAVVVDYLGRAGDNPAGPKWRWLAHAVFLARHRLNNLDLALDLAYKLARLQPIGDEMPIWARQMPALVLKERGEKDDARKIVEGILASSQNLHPQEVNFLKAYLVEQLGIPADEVEKISALRGKE